MSVMLEPVVQVTLRTQVGPNEYGTIQILNQEAELTVSQLAALMGGGGGGWVGTATTDLNMDGNDIDNADGITATGYVAGPQGYFDNIANLGETPSIGVQANLTIPGFSLILNTIEEFGFNTGAFTPVHVVANASVMLSFDTEGSFAIGPAAGNGIFEVDNAVVYVNAGFHCGALPITDPVIAGRIWNDAGTLKVSEGAP